jgi:hypothetical protein
MSAENYLKDNYYLNGAVGPDYKLWKGRVQKNTSDNTNIKGYFSRIKKLNSLIIPENKVLTGLRADLT